VFSLFKKQPLLEEAVVVWLFDAFGWSLRNFGSHHFYGDTELVTPSNRHFPGREESVEGMAALILDRVKAYAGVSHWPTRLLNHHDYEGDPMAEPSSRQVLANSAELKLTLFYEPQQVANPQAMIANYAHALAHHLGGMANESPPCEQEHWPHLTEVLSVYLGFGVIMANSAHPFRGGGCGSCRSAAMDRSGFLAENEITYALAIFCVLKALPAAEVSGLLKSSLRSFFKKAVKEVSERQEALAVLRAIDCSAPQYGATAILSR